MERDKEKRKLSFSNYPRNTYTQQIYTKSFSLFLWMNKLHRSEKRTRTMTGNWTCWFLICSFRFNLRNRCTASSCCLPSATSSSYVFNYTTGLFHSLVHILVLSDHPKCRTCACFGSGCPQWWCRAWHICSTLPLFLELSSSSVEISGYSRRRRCPTEECMTFIMWVHLDLYLSTARSKANLLMIFLIWNLTHFFCFSN